MASEHTGGIVKRVQDFVSENKRAIIIGTAALALAAGGAAAYYASTSSWPRCGEGGELKVVMGRGEGPSAEG